MVHTGITALFVAEDKEAIEYLVDTHKFAIDSNLQVCRTGVLALKKETSKGVLNIHIVYIASMLNTISLITGYFDNEASTTHVHRPLTGMDPLRDIRSYLHEVGELYKV